MYPQQAIPLVLAGVLKETLSSAWCFVNMVYCVCDYIELIITNDSTKEAILQGSPTNSSAVLIK